MRASGFGWFAACFRRGGNPPGGYTYTYNYTARANNGKISSAVVSGETITYQYDSLNRLISAAGSGGGSGAWSDAYAYDAFGNLLSKSQTGGAPTLSQNLNLANNEILGQSYDLNGNQLTAGCHRLSDL